MMASSGGGLDQAALLGSGDRISGGPPGVLDAFRFLRRAGGGGRAPMPSVLVREAAAEQLEERRSDWAYSKPVVFLDVMWNLAILVAAAGILFSSCREKPTMPLRLWIAGYALQCVVHVACVVVEYRRRHFGRGDARGERIGFVKHVESANTLFSFFWWIIGFYWVSTGGEDLTRDASQLYWFSFFASSKLLFKRLLFFPPSIYQYSNLWCRLCVVFLAFDVLFVVFCVAVACVVGIAVCCCLPCIIAILYAVTDQQDGASAEEIRQLPKYEFRRVGDADIPGEVSGPFGGIMSECGNEAPIEHVVSPEDAECCICLTDYDDGVELRELPCRHHFHCACVDKWLCINATCPLCKYNVSARRSGGADAV